MSFKTLVKRVVPRKTWDSWRQRRSDLEDWVEDLPRLLSRRPPIGWVRFGHLRRLTPISADFGWDRGRPVDRFYIDEFIARHAADVRGRVLEVGTAMYTKRLGAGRVTRSDVLHILEGNPEATIVADLTRADQIPSNAFDCVILTQTLQCIYDMRAALRHLHRILKPGGALLATTNGINKISMQDMAQWGEYWRLTSRSARMLFEEFFPPERVTVDAAGNLVSAVAMLHGIAAEELTAHELAHRDPAFEVLIAIRAVKP